MATQRLNSEYSKEVEDQTTKTTVDPKEVEKYSRKEINWTPKLKAQYEKEKQDLADQFEIDPATGRYKGTPGALLGFDPDEYIKEQEDKERNARVRGAIKNWSNFALTLADIGTQHGGGTVWERKPDNEGAKIDAEVEKAKENKLRMQQAVPNAFATREQQYREAERKRVNDFLKNNEQTVTYTNTTGGNREVVKSGGDVKTHRYWDAQVKNSTGNGGGGSGSQREMVVIHNDAYNHFNIPTQTYESVKNYLISHYCDILNEKDPNTNETTERAREFRKQLQSMGILGKRNGPKWNASNFQKDEVMRNGEFFYLTDLEYNKIKELTGIDLRNPTQDETQSTQQNTTSTLRRRSVAGSATTTTTATTVSRTATR